MENYFSGVESCIQAFEFLHKNMPDKYYGVIIGSWLKDEHHDYGDVCEEYVKVFMDKVREFKAKTIG